LLLEYTNRISPLFDSGIEAYPLQELVYTNISAQPLRA